MKGNHAMKCPHCENGKTEISVTVYGKGPLSSSKSTITCVTCNGSGEITEAQAAKIKAMDDIWCKCKEPGDPVYYELAGGSHGYDCATCGGLLQTG
jgi:hypothetical protein